MTKPKPSFIALPEAMQEMFKPENLPGPGFRRGYVLALAPRYIRELAGAPMLAAVRRIAFTNNEAAPCLLIEMEHAAARQEMQMHRERLRQQLNTRLKQAFIARIRII